MGVVGISINDAWAVGFTDIAGNSSNRQPLTIHWDGVHWHNVSNPPLAGAYNILNGVAATSTHDVWAVGQGYAFGGQAFIEHWDGTSWSISSSPVVGTNAVLNAIASVPGTNELWAVGYYSGNNSSNALFEHWDGSQWNVIPSPPVNSNNSELQSITAFSSTDVWAVGSVEIDGGVGQTLIEHWDGTSWSVVPSPNFSQPGTGNPPSGSLFSIAPVPNTNELWAVGYSDGNRTNVTLIEHWDGTSWNIVPGANVRASFLFGTEATAPNDIWSVGIHGGISLIEHWDGVQWSIASQPAQAMFHSDFRGIAKVPNRTYIWAVGTFYTAATKMYHPLTLLYC